MRSPSAYGGCMRGLPCLGKRSLLPVKMLAVAAMLLAAAVCCSRWVPARSRWGPRSELQAVGVDTGGEGRRAATSTCPSSGRVDRGCRAAPAVRTSPQTGLASTAASAPAADARPRPPPRPLTPRRAGRAEGAELAVLDARKPLAGRAVGAMPQLDVGVEGVAISGEHHLHLFHRR